MTIRKEITIGIIGSLIIIGMVFLNIDKFYKVKNKLLNKNQIAKNNISQKSTESKNSTLTLEEIAKHNNQNDCWIIINNSVYNVTSYLAIHPGGDKIIISYCGNDATSAYNNKGGKGSHSNNADKDLSLLKIGDLNEKIDLQKAKNTTINKLKNLQKRERKEEYEDD